MNYMSAYEILTMTYWHYIKLVTNVEDPSDEKAIRLDYVTNFCMNLGSSVYKQYLTKLYKDYKQDNQNKDEEGFSLYVASVRFFSTK